MALEYSRNTVGCRINNQIIVHPELYKYPELYKSIVLHEKKHTDGIGSNDFKIDLFNDDLKNVKKDFYKFILTHPRTLIGWLPVAKIGKYWCFDLSMTIFWLIFIIGFIIGVKL